MGAAGVHYQYQTPRQQKRPADKDGTPCTSRRRSSGSGLSRRELLGTTAVWLLFSATSARALVVQGNLPWAPNAGAPPAPVHPGRWVYLTPEEGAAVEALVDRLIPPDPQTPGGKDAGCAVFIDRQLAGPYGSHEGLYMRGPFAEGVVRGAFDLVWSFDSAGVLDGSRVRTLETPLHGVAFDRSGDFGFPERARVRACNPIAGLLQYERGCAAARIQRDSGIPGA